MKVSVAMLTYNHENYISQAIESVLMQITEFDYEIIIGEDYSTDNTLKILEKYEEKYPNKVKILKRNKNIGVVKNVIDVYSNCSGEYIALLEGDDYWTDKFKLRTCINYLENNKENIGVFHNINVIDFKGEIKNSIIFKNFSDIDSIDDHIEGKIMHTLSLVFRNIFLDRKKLQIYEKMLNDVKYICDYPLKAYLLTFGKFKFIDKTMGTYREINEFGSSWSAQSSEVKFKDKIKMLENMAAILGIEIEQKIRKIYISSILVLCILYLKNIEIKKCFKLLKEKNIKVKDYIFFIYEKLINRLFRRP